MMLKKIAIITAVFLVFPLMLMACKNDADTVTTDTVYYTVSFNSNGGSTVKPQTVASGGKVSLPITPEYTNFVFREWRYEGKTWNFEYDTLPQAQYDEQEKEIYQETKLYAKWIKN